MTPEQCAKDLHSILIEIKKLMENILASEDAKYDILRVLDIDKLIDNNAKEEELLLRFDALEKKRQDSVENFAILNGCGTELSLSELSKFMSEDNKQLCIKVADDIRVLTEQLSTAAERNRHILANNAEIIGSILKIMDGAISQKYDNSGSECEERHSLHLLDHTV
ncbi:MAG: flagellar protein FlgN [Brevinema sp.]